MPLETMNFNLLFLHNASLNEEEGHVLPLIALQLNYLPQLWILHHRPITTELFLEILQNLTVFELFLQALHRCQTFPPITLLNPDMDIVFGSRPRRIRIFFLEWVERSGDLNLQIRHETELLGM
eukprot:c22937_g1_i3 orf=2-370(-)